MRDAQGETPSDASAADAARSAFVSKRHSRQSLTSASNLRTLAHSQHAALSAPAAVEEEGGAKAEEAEEASTTRTSAGDTVSWHGHVSGVQLMRRRASSDGQVSGSRGELLDTLQSGRTSRISLSRALGASAEEAGDGDEEGGGGDGGGGEEEVVSGRGGGDPAADVGVATEVVPGLYLSDFRGCYAALRKRSSKLSHVLNAAEPVAGFSRPRGVISVDLGLKDADDEDLLAAIPLAARFIDVGRVGGGVLVHCMAGRSRGPAVCVAYLVAAYDLPVEDAVELVVVRARAKRACACVWRDSADAVTLSLSRQTARPSIAIRRSFMRQLVAFADPTHPRRRETAAARGTGGGEEEEGVEEEEEEEV